MTRFSRVATWVRRNGIFLCILVVFCALHLVSMGTVTPTADEATDLSIVSCLTTLKNPFACTADISQVRLPYYLHALLVPIMTPLFGSNAHYGVSFLFSCFSLVLMYLFARRITNQTTATLTAALMTLSIPLLTSGRMLLTHANTIFVFTTILTVFSFWYYLERESFARLSGVAIAFGLSVASSVLGIFTGLLLLLWYALTRTREKKWRVRTFLIIPFSVVVFFAVTLIYLRPENVQELFAAVLHTSPPSYWNYASTGSPYAPIWFSALLFVIKGTPWWTVLFVLGGVFIFSAHGELANTTKRFLQSVGMWIAVVAVLKSVIFRYDAPHHQAHLFPFVLLIASVGIVHISTLLRSRKILAWLWYAVIGGLMFLQALSVLWFFPNLAFFGSQFGSRFIGEFYGPAVMHCQNRDHFITSLAPLIASGESLVVPDAPSCLEYPRIPGGIPFSRAASKDTPYRYAVSDMLVTNHYKRSEAQEKYQQFLVDSCVPLFSLTFPPQVPAYTLFRCATRAS